MDKHKVETINMSEIYENIDEFLAKKLAKETTAEENRAVTSIIRILDLSLWLPMKPSHNHW